jgi:hypothetical protein
MIKHGLLLERGTAFDLEPFPMIPAGALKMDTIFLVEGGLHLLTQVDVKNIFVVVDVGAVYLIEAITKWDRYNDYNFAYSSDVADSSLPSIFDNVFGAMTNTRNKTLAIVPGNILSDLDLQKVERFHVNKKKPAMTLVVTPGIPEQEYVNMPVLYRPSRVAIVEPSVVLHLKGVECRDFNELISILDKKGLISYYPYDGLMFEVEDPATFNLINGVDNV